MSTLINQNPYSPQVKMATFRDHIDKWLTGKKIYPVMVELSPSYGCNQNCSWCFYNSGENGTGSDSFIDPEVMKKCIIELSSLGVKAVNFTGEGEPTLHKDFDYMAQVAHDSGLEIGLFTNGTKEIKSPENFSWIRISVTSSYKLNTDIIERYSRVTDVGVCVNYCKESEEHIDSLCMRAKNSGARHFQVRPALNGPEDRQEEFTMPVGLKQHETSNFKVIFPYYKWSDYTVKRTYDICYGHYFCPAITHEGNVNACMYHLGDENFIFGNIYEQSFEEIWESKARTEAISRMELNGCQTCCKNHEINKILYAIKHPETVKNRNFL